MRDAGCLMHPQPCAQKRAARPRTSLHSGGTGKPGNPARNGLLIIPCSPRGGAHCARHPADKVLSAPGWADEPPQDLTPASGVGPHGFSVRFDIVRPARPSSAHRLNLMAACPANSDHARYRRVHRISSRVRDDRETPLVWDETKRVIGCFEQKGNRNIFRSGAGQKRNTRSGPVGGLFAAIGTSGLQGRIWGHSQNCYRAIRFAMLNRGERATPEQVQVACRRFDE